MSEKAAALVMGFVATLTIPLLILNMTSGIIGGIWLAIRGEWSLVVFGIGAMFFGGFFLGFSLLIGAAIAALGTKISSVVIRYSLFALGFVFNFAVMVGWAISTFTFSIDRPQNNIWPYLLWGYSIATVPWVSMARGDNSEGTVMWISASQFGALAVIISVLIGNGYQSDEVMRSYFVTAALLGLGLSYLMHWSARQ